MHVDLENVDSVHSYLSPYVNRMDISILCVADSMHQVYFTSYIMPCMPGAIFSHELRDTFIVELCLLAYYAIYILLWLLVRLLYMHTHSSASV